MKIDRTAVLVCLALLSTPSFYASAERVGSNSNPEPTEPVSSSSSSTTLPDAPDAALIEAAATRAVRNGSRTSLRLETRAFSAWAVAVTTGLGGLGIDVATPLATKVNLRVSANFLSYSPTINEEGIPIAAAIRLRTVGAGVELFPYHNSSFHITPGLTMYNGNRMDATVNVPGGQTFTINDTDYVSAVGDPMHGNFNVDLTSRFTPSLTVGFGNMLRRDSHWSIPVDVGFQYIGQPKFTLSMLGSVCDASDGCTPIQSDPDTVANLSAEQTKINQEISPLRFYPILKVGLSYRFGRNVKREYWY